jgi:hypothetical protein
MAFFCLIHGQWHDGSCWTPVVERLAARGHSAATPDLPFDDPRADYPARVRPALEALVGVDSPIVVVGHSIASAEAALVASERRPTLLVHLCPRFGTFPIPPDAPPVFRAGFPSRRAMRRTAERPDVLTDLLDRLAVEAIESESA